MVSEQVMQAMFNHLVQSYTTEEAREILIQKYPEAEGDISLMTGMSLPEIPEDEPAVEQTKLVKAVKEKVAKPAKAKAVKAPKPAKVKVERNARANSKLARARELFINLTKQGKSRGEIINAFMTELEMQKAGATTYYYNVQK